MASDDNSPKIAYADWLYKRSAVPADRARGVRLWEELRAAGYEPVGVPDVERAQNLLSQLTPAMIVCDVNLPGKSGLEFMSELRTGEHLSDVPFMLLTALAS